MYKPVLHQLAACKQMMDACDAGICAVTHVATVTARMSAMALGPSERSQRDGTAYGLRASRIAACARMTRCESAEGDMRHVCPLASVVSPTPRAP